MKRAFTLIEMVVSISVIALVSTLFAVNYRSANQRTDLILAAQSLVADLHAAQNNALGLSKYSGVVPAGGWGVSLAAGTNTYAMFADLEAPGVSGSLAYDPEAEGNPAYGARLTVLPAGITISNLATVAESSTPAVNVIFLPPDPQTSIYDVTTVGTSTALEITLFEDRNSTVKTVRVNFLGLIEVID